MQLIDLSDYIDDFKSSRLKTETFHVQPGSLCWIMIIASFFLFSSPNKGYFFEIVSML